ncbi:hypothetical protein RCH14_000371 [Massilia sp. MP_M2]
MQQDNEPGTLGCDAAGELSLRVHVPQHQSRLIEKQFAHIPFWRI